MRTLPFGIRLTWTGGRGHAMAADHWPTCADVVFETVTGTPALVVTLVLKSLATAYRVCDPTLADVVSHWRVKGGESFSLPRFVLSSRYCTPATPTLSAAFTVTLTVPVTVAPLAGAVIDTVGGVVSCGGAIPRAVTMSFWISPAESARL